MLGSMKEPEARLILELNSDNHFDPKTRELTKRVLNAGVLDINSIQKVLGVDELLNR